MNRDWDFTDDKKLQRGVICRKHKTVMVLVWSNEWKQLHRQASMHWIKMDWQRYSYAQISPFKSIEFEIFAKNLSFLMFKSYKSTIMQIWLTHDRGLTKRPSTIQKWLKVGVKNMGSSFRNNIFGVGWTFFILSAGGELPIMQGTEFPRYKTPTRAKNTILLLLGLVKLISIQRAFYWRVVFVYCLHHCFKDLQYFYIFFNCFPMSLINPVLQMHPCAVAVSKSC